MTALWYPLAIRLDAPAWKQGYEGIPQRDWRGAVLHSMEGSLAAAHSVLQGAVKSSWHFSNPKVGPLEQHYPISAVTWHGGSSEANRRFVGVEHEGVAGESLTESQIENDVGLLLWLAENDVQPWPGFIRLDTLWEHNEMTRFGARATACPSGRIPWQEVIELATLIQDLEARVAVLEQHVPFANAALAKHEEKLGTLDNHNAFADAVIASHEERIKKLEK